MNSRRCQSLPVIVHLFALLLMVIIPASLSNPELYRNCHDSLFTCGIFSAGYPFSGGDRPPECGHRGLELRCDDYTPIIEILDAEYQVLDIHPDPQILRIARYDLIKNGFCKPQIQDSILLDYNLFEFVNAPTGSYTNITLLYNCPVSSIPRSSLGSITCDKINANGASFKDVSVMLGDYYVRERPCAANVTVPVPHASLAGATNNISSSLLEEALRKGFEVRWKGDREACRKCEQSGGACGFYPGNGTACYFNIPSPPAPPPAGTQAQGK